MPIYEYACSGCGIKFEMHRSISDETLPGCPSCKAVEVKKLISQTAFQLKGSGWYKDGYGSAAPKAVVPEVSKEAKPAEAASTPKVEKPASETTATPAAKDSSTKKEAAGS